MERKHDNIRPSSPDLPQAALVLLILLLVLLSGATAGCQALTTTSSTTALSSATTTQAGRGTTTGTSLPEPGLTTTQPTAQVTTATTTGDQVTTTKPTAATIPTTRSTVQGPDGGPAVYSNDQYGFRFFLPASWQDFTIVADQWQGYALTGKQAGAVTETGPLLSIRHPFWTSEVPRQDIPVMIFTLSQWTALQDEQISVGAAPIPPSELGRNKHYVFALPARYNYAFPAGYEEVEEILKSNPLEPFDP